MVEIIGNLESNRFVIRSSPSESLSLNLNLTVGRDLAYNNVIPEKGKEFTFNFIFCFVCGAQQDNSTLIQAE